MAEWPCEPHAEGTVLLVRAQPGAKQAGIGPIQDGHLKVRVTEVAERGKANQAIRDLLIKQLGLRRSQVTLLSGETASVKRYLLAGLAPSDCIDRLRALLDD